MNARFDRLDCPRLLTAPRRMALAVFTPVAVCAALSACSAPDDADGAPSYTGSLAGGATNTGTPAGGATNTTPPPNDTSNPPVASAGASNEGQGGAGLPINSGAGGSGNTAAAGAGNTGVGGSVSAGGSAQAGSGGASSNAAGAPPVTAGAGGTGDVQEPPAPTGPDIECPAGASFCSGFESGSFPEGTVDHAVGPPADGAFAFDTANAFEGTTSLSIPATGSGGFFYRALAVPVPGNDFWVRLYMNLSTPLGDNSHDSVFGASTGPVAADVNNENLVELSEQFNEILLNTKDVLFNPTANNTLPANQWLCMEAHYNGNSGDVQIFADGNELINAPAYRTATFASFRIGYMRYNDDRTVRYDNVVVAPARVGCD